MDILAMGSHHRLKFQRVPISSLVWTRSCGLGAWPHQLARLDPLLRSSDSVLRKRELLQAAKKKRNKSKNFSPLLCRRSGPCQVAV